MAIEVFDDIIPMNIRNFIYSFAVNSKYKIVGWNDRNDLELIDKHDLHSPWSYEDLENSKIVPYISKVLKKSKHFNSYTIKATPSTSNDFFSCTINAVKPNDHYFTHSHLEGTISVLYYINMEWQHNWAGETIFYKENMKDINFTSSFVPGRFILFEDEPHTIRPQSFIGPAYRFTMALFLEKKKGKK
jgi:Rps23 Pro-64 3,4-dihydroxylase Tpa1-like proline 4-hydroxylase